MRFSAVSVCTSLVAFVQVISAGQGGWITLVNSTPYEWRCTYSHQYQMQWEAVDKVSPGSSQEFYYEFKRNADDGAEASYELIGHPTRASFTVQARGTSSKRIQVQYHDHLSSLNNPVDSLINLDWEHDGAVPFILSGDGIDTPFISSNPPVAWMQATLPTIGHKSMAEICMPASHDSGASEISRSYLGVKHNVLTQSGNIYNQLMSGTRSFDIRPVIRRKKWYTAHISIFSKKFALGGFGRTIQNIVSDINQFTTEHPGELIILDINHDLDSNGWSRVNPKQWQALYRELLDIDDIWIAPSSLRRDITTVPISTFIRPGSKSAVIIRVPNYAPLPNLKLISLIPRSLDLENLQSFNMTDISGNEDNAEDNYPSTLDSKEFTINEADVPHPFQSFGVSMAKSNPTIQSKLSLPPNATLGFFQRWRFPITGTYSNTESPNFLAEDQLEKLSANRASPSSGMHQSTWTLTQGTAKVLSVANKKDSILFMAALAHRALFRDLWGALSEKTYPNLIEVDDVWGSQFAALCMAINQQFVGKTVSRKRLMGRERRVWDTLEDGAKDVVKTLKKAEDAVSGSLSRLWEEDRVGESRMRGVIKLLGIH